MSKTHEPRDLGHLTEAIGSLEHLNDAFGALKEERSNLMRQVESLENELNGQFFGWTRHREVKHPAEEVPYLEVLRVTTTHQSRVTLLLVLPARYPMDAAEGIPLMETIQSGGPSGHHEPRPPDYSRPMIDGRRLSKLMNLPLYSRTGDEPHTTREVTP